MTIVDQAVQKPRQKIKHGVKTCQPQPITKTPNTTGTPKIERIMNQVLTITRQSFLLQLLNITYTFDQH